MRRSLLSLTIATSLFLLFDASTAVRKNLDLATISNNFTCTCVRTLLSDYSNVNTNFLVSPWNIQNAVFVLMNAAKGKTYKEIAQVFGIQNSSSKLRNINSQFKDFLKQLQVNTKETQVDSVTALYVEKTCPLRKSYKTKMAYYYGAQTETEDFQHNSTAITKEINSFVNEKTHGKIPQFYDRTLSPNTRLIILTVEYFNSSWYDNFFVLNNQKSTFYLSSGESKSLQCLSNHNAQRKAGYTVFDSCRIVRIPFNGNFSFFVFLPPRGQDPSICLKKLTVENIPKLYSATENPQSVNITMPRFAFTDTFNNLEADFQNLGVKQAFTNANLKHGIDQCKCGRLYVDEIRHECRIEVSEKGAMATAVTGISVGALAMPIPISEPPQYNVDHPFAFGIACNNLKIFLFVGKCANPIYPNN